MECCLQAGWFRNPSTQTAAFKLCPMKCLFSYAVVHFMLLSGASHSDKHLCDCVLLPRFLLGCGCKRTHAADRLNVCLGTGFVLICQLLMLLLHPSSLFFGLTVFCNFLFIIAMYLYLSICMSLSIYLSIYLAVCLSVYPTLPCRILLYPAVLCPTLPTLFYLVSSPLLWFDLVSSSPVLPDFASSHFV